MPCSYVTPTTEQNTEYYLVHGRSNPNLGGDTLQEIAQQLENYESSLKEMNKERQELHAYYVKYIGDKPFAEIDDNIWGFYSDWHKDLFGHRPRSYCRCG